MNNSFITEPFFSGGAGMFIQYHDAIKPVYLMAIIKLLYDNPYQLPVGILEKFSIISLLEWYIHRRYRNPIECLDWQHQITVEDSNRILKELLTDTSLYKLAPILNFHRYLEVYRKQYMTFPFYIYSEEYEKGIEEDCIRIFNGISYRYLYGDLKDAIMKSDNNFTYIFSDIYLLQKATEILFGTCSNVLLVSDFRYNYIGNYKSPKLDLKTLMDDHPYIRLGTTSVINGPELIQSMNHTLGG